MSIAKTEECGGGDAVVVLDGSLIETNNNNTTTFNKLNELKSIDLAANNNNKNNNSAVVSALLTANNNSTSNSSSSTNGTNSSNKTDTMFTLKRWNLVAMWSWDVECEVCAICRTPLMDSCLKCQTDNKHEDCVVVWGDCNHSFHNCCMSQWIKSRNLCPLCQSEWHVQRIGR